MTAALIGLLGNASPKLAADVHRRISDRRRMANVLRRFNRDLLANEAELRSIAKCGNTLGSTVMFHRGPDGIVRPGGVATCKSVWGCLGCAARRRALKSAMVKYYVDAHLGAGRGVSFGSFTLAHYASDSLADLLEGLRNAFTDMRHLKVYKDAEAEYGIIGWIAALEIMLRNHAISNLIRESKTHQITNTIVMGRKEGMQLMDDHLKQLISAKVVTPEEAARYSENPQAILAHGRSVGASPQIAA